MLEQVPHAETPCQRFMFWADEPVSRESLSDAVGVSPSACPSKHSGIYYLKRSHRQEAKSSLKLPIIRVIINVKKAPGN